MSLLSTSGVEFSYPGGVRAVNGVSLDVHAGELLVVLGPNGSGKSTLLKLLGGLLMPDRGDVRWRGDPLSGFSIRERAHKVAVVPQALQALPIVSVRRFVEGGRYSHLGFWRQITPADREVVERTLDQADIADLGERMLDELSGGQRQRALIARALAQESDLMLIDEPTNSLDPEHQISVFQLIAELCQGSHAAVVVTHDLNLASQFATKIALLRDGQVAAYGTADEVLSEAALEPVYGSQLRYGRWEGPGGGDTRPFVIPWVD